MVTLCTIASVELLTSKTSIERALLFIYFLSLNQFAIRPRDKLYSTPSLALSRPDGQRRLCKFHNRAFFPSRACWRSKKNSSRSSRSHKLSARKKKAGVKTFREGAETMLLSPAISEDWNYSRKSLARLKTNDLILANFLVFFLFFLLMKHSNPRERGCEAQGFKINIYRPTREWTPISRISTYYLLIHLFISIIRLQK